MLNLASARLAFSRPHFAWGCAAILVFALLCAWFAQRPSYLDLDIPVKPFPRLGYFWYETSYTQLRYSDSPGALYVLRRVGRARSRVQGWRNETEVMAFFDRWLRQHGWEYRESSYPHAILPESRFLRSGIEYRLYLRPGDPWGYGPLVGVAVAPLQDESFDITLVTSRPSWLRSLATSLD